VGPKVNQSCPKTRTGIVQKCMYNFAESFWSTSNVDYCG